MKAYIGAIPNSNIFVTLSALIKICYFKVEHILTRGKITLYKHILAFVINLYPFSCHFCIINH